MCNIFLWGPERVSVVPSPTDGEHGQAEGRFPFGSPVSAIADKYSVSLVPVEFSMQ
jgi:hypothetical protein